MTDRVPLDHLTSDQLDALYERLEAAEETESQRQLATAREAFASATTRAARAEAALARVQALADSWVKAGPPPLGTPLARWWDKRLVELNAALGEPTPATRATDTADPRHDHGPSIAEAREADRRWPLQKHGE
jgi:hypothetical protein